MDIDFSAGNRTRVLINAIHAKTGGGVTYLRNVLPHLAARPELEVHVLLHPSQYDLFHPLPDGVRPHMPRFAPGFVASAVWEQTVLPVLARMMRADVVFSLANYGPVFAPGHVIMLRNALAVFGREERLSKRAYWAALAGMTAISLMFARKAVAVSDYARRTLSFGLGRLFSERIEVIHHGVSELFRADTPAEPEPDTLLVVGDIYVQKNLVTVIRMLGRLVETRPDVRLRIAGRPVDADYHATVTDLVEELGLQAHVEFLGRVEAEELARLYRTHAVFLFPSTVETFGNPLVEAMASGACIACSNTTAMPEIAGSAAAFFDPASVEDMRAVVEGLLDDEARRLELRAKALRRAEGFSWDATAERTARLLVRANRRLVS